jgi:hypothetical protein
MPRTRWTIVYFQGVCPTRPGRTRLPGHTQSGPIVSQAAQRPARTWLPTEGLRAVRRCIDPDAHPPNPMDVPLRGGGVHGPWSGGWRRRHRGRSGYGRCRGDGHCRYGANVSPIHEATNHAQITTSQRYVHWARGLAGSAATCCRSNRLRASWAAAAFLPLARSSWGRRGNGELFPRHLSTMGSHFVYPPIES